MQAFAARTAAAARGGRAVAGRPAAPMPLVRSILQGARIQPKLKVGAVNDPAEAEADRVAERVMRKPEPGIAAGEAGAPPVAPGTGGSSPPPVRRKCAACTAGDEPVDAAPSSQVRRFSAGERIQHQWAGYEAESDPLLSPGMAPVPAILRRQPSSPAAADQNVDDYHVAVAGDTYWALAQAHGVSVRELMLWNQYPAEAIPIGASLRVEKPKILITFFNVFPGASENRSEQSIESISAGEITALETRYGVEIDTHRVDTSVSRPEGVNDFINRYVRDNALDYDVVVSTGQGDANIHFETTAGNAIVMSFIDNSGGSQAGQRVDPSLPESQMFSGGIMTDARRRRAFEASIRGTAAGTHYRAALGLNEDPSGRYLCNYLTGHLISRSQQPRSLLATQFIHLSEDATRIRQNREFVLAFLRFVCAQQIYNSP